MATAIGKHVDKLTRGVYSAHGFAYAQILTHWETIVGAEMAKFCRPTRLRWPKGQERIKDERRRLGGTLTVALSLFAFASEPLAVALGGSVALVAAGALAAALSTGPSSTYLTPRCLPASSW